MDKILHPFIYRRGQVVADISWAEEDMPSLQRKNTQINVGGKGRDRLVLKRAVGGKRFGGLMD
jgi:hypothetical protein